MKIFTFPGQGSQFVGMGRDLYDNFQVAKEVFEEVDDALSFKLSDVIFNGPEEFLSMTENTQPALMAVSIAALRVLLKERGKRLEEIAGYLAGHSLGEYSALCASGAVTVGDVAKILKVRGKAMQSAVPPGQGSMIAVLKVGYKQIESLIRESGLNCEISNDNSEEQVVVSGPSSEIDSFSNYLKENGIKRVVKLNVSAPFHCRLMVEAVPPVKEILLATRMDRMSVPIISNVTAQPVSDVDSMKELLVQQITNCVRWREITSFAVAGGVTSFIEIGAGSVLTKMVTRSFPAVEAKNFGTIDELESVVCTLT